MKTSPKPVLETYIREVTTLVHLTVNGEEIITTVDHPFYVKNQGFIKAGELIVGDELLDVNGNVFLVENFDIELTDEPVKVYNFQVGDFHTYHVGENGVWVHNSNCKLIKNDDGTYDNGRLNHKSNTPGKLSGDDAGHLFADQFGGSPDLDNLVSQKSDLNRAVKNTDNYRSMEREWSKALKSGKKVTDVDIKLTYENGLSRPSVFDVSYKIDDLKIIRHFTQ